MAVASNRDKKVHIGWLRRASAKDKYVQINAPLAGIRVLNLQQQSTQYSVQEFITTAVEEFSKNPPCAELLKQSKSILVFLMAL